MSEIQTLDEYLAWQTERAKEKGNGPDSKPAGPDTLRLVLQAAVQADNLTGDQHWDYYLQCLQGKVEEFQAAERHNLERLADSRVIDHSALLTVKMALADIRATIRALEWAIELPQSIKETGKAAKALAVPDTDLTSS